jgi:hypothetical protein
MGKSSFAKQLFRAIVLIASIFGSIGISDAQTCHTYTQTGLQYFPTYGYSCGGISNYSCTECHRWTSPGHVDSCVKHGSGNCFEEEHQHT